MPEPTVLIIGAGTFGTSTAYHLAKSYNDPSQVTIIERWDPSSSGSKVAAAIDVNRIIRTDYVSPLYCNLANEAIHPWFWDIDLGHFFHKTGWVVLNERGSDFSSSVRHTFQQRGSDYTKGLDVHDFAKRHDVLNGMATEDFGDAYYNPEAGWCDAAFATARFMTVAEKKGVKRVTADVQELIFDKLQGRLTGVRTTNGQEFKADKIVLATGAWTSKLLASVEDLLRLQQDDRIEGQIKAVGRVSAYYMLSSHETDLICKDELPIVVYGDRAILTPPSRENRTLKINDLETEFVNTVSMPSGHRISVPSERNQEDVPKKLQLKSGELLNRLVPSLAQDREPDRWRMCWDTATPTGDWLLCRHPQRKLDNLFIAAGGNFSSYKFLPVAGKYVCNLLKGQSNGPERDEAWSWKSKELLLRGNGDKKELGSRSLAGRPELRDFTDVDHVSRL